MGPTTTSLRSSQYLAKVMRGPPVPTQRKEEELPKRQKPYAVRKWARQAVGRNSGTHRRIHIQAKTDKDSDVRHDGSTKYTS